MKANSLRILLLGSPRIELDERLVEIKLHKALALLAYLAVSEQNHRRDTLATFFWPDYNQSKARSYFRNALWLLKKTLGEGLFCIRREEVGLQFRTVIWVDVLNFRQYLRTVDIHRIQHTTEDPCQACITNLSEAVELYRDDFLSGFTLPDSPAFDNWQCFQTEGLRLAFIGALEQLARWHLEQDDYLTSICYARRWILLDPFNESARRLLMKAYFQSGHRSAAFRQYQDYLQILKLELNVLPSVEITELYYSMKAGRFQPTNASC